MGRKDITQRHSSVSSRDRFNLCREEGVRVEGRGHAPTVGIRGADATGIWCTEYTVGKWLRGGGVVVAAVIGPGSHGRVVSSFAYSTQPKDLDVVAVGGLALAPRICVI
ncbi:hypothetical protein J6590_032790 [Homalodisca vitripennis]|nr:hypothetical protein J6590_032790 [Homalodisca vitripennis]